MRDPMTDIENMKGNKDMGTTLCQVFEGAMIESNDPIRAFYVTAAFFYAMIKSGQEQSNE